MQRVPKRAQRGFLKRFAAGRVRVHGGGDVFESRAHFHGERERCGEFANMLTDGLHAEHQVIVLARDDAHEAFAVTGTQCAPAGLERELLADAWQPEPLGALR